MHITDISVKRPVTIAMICLAVIMLGTYSFSKLSLDFLPDIDIPNLIIKTDYPNANAREIEQNVSRFIEANLTTLHDIRKIKSISREGVSFINLEFNWGTDMDIAFIKVRSKLDRIQESLPDGAERPTLLHFDPSSAPIMTFIITGERLSKPKSPTDYKEALVELKEVASSIVKRRLEQLDGIAHVLVSGGLEREIQIILDKEKCLSFDIAFSEIESALRRFNVSVSGGSIREGYFQYPLRVEAEYSNVNEINATPVKYAPNGRAITLKDVAHVVDGYKIKQGYTQYNGKEIITLFLFKEAGANTIDASQKVYTTLYQLYQEYPEFKVLPVFDQAEFIQDSIDNVLQALFLGGIFAFLVLFYFLKDLKSPIMIGVSIPISIITTLILMYFMNINFNIISLGGLALGIGMLVDNSIVVLENIYRYKEMGYSLIESAKKGTKEVSLAITASTFTTISVFLPLIYIEGLAGELFYDQAITISISLTVSLLVSVTLLAMLSSKFTNTFSIIRADWDMQTFNWQKSPLEAKGILKKITHSFSKFLESVFYTLFYIVNKWLYLPIFTLFKYSIDYFQKYFSQLSAYYELKLEEALQKRGRILIATFIIFLLSSVLFLFLNKELMPTVDRKQLVIQAVLPEGSGLTAISSMVKQLEQTLLRQPGIKSVLSSVGITESPLDQTYQAAINKAILDLEIKEGFNIVEITEKLNVIFEQFNNIDLIIAYRESIFEQLFQQKDKKFDIKISGSGLETLEKLSTDILGFLEKIGIKNIVTTLKKGQDEHVLKLNRERMMHFDISMAELTNFLKNQIQGSVPTQFIDFSDKIDIKVYNRNFDELNLERMQNLKYIHKNGKTNTYIPLKELYTYNTITGYSEILREDQNRVVAISGVLNDLSFFDIKQQMDSFLSHLKIPAGYLVEIGASKKAISDNFQNLLYIFIISLALVFFILAAQFESIKIPLVIIATIPLSFIGIVLTLLVTGNSLNIMSFLGSIILVGIIVNDSIVKIDFIHRHYSEKADLKNAILEAGKKRFRPIIMTTTTTVFGLLPMALATGRGSELRQPLAWVVIGGLTMATVLTLIIVPLIYSYMVKQKI